MADPRTDLRGAVARGDGLALVALLTDPKGWPVHALQLAGGGLLGAVAAPVDGAVPLAQRWIEALHERAWDGDAELATALGTLLGTAPAPVLRPLSVDVAELAAILEGDPAHGGGRIDLRTGEVWPQAALDYLDEVGEGTDDADDADDERWLWVDPAGSPPGYRDMEAFIAALDDTERADRLAAAITGRGAFRRFKDVIARWPDLAQRWHAFSEDRTLGRARLWLADNGYTPNPPRSRP